MKNIPGARQRKEVFIKKTDKRSQHMFNVVKDSKALANHKTHTKGSKRLL